MKNDTPPAYPPETLEGWYSLHQIFRVDRAAAASNAITESLASRPELPGLRPRDGWSACVKLIGSRADLMLVHFRPTLEAISEVQTQFGAHAISRVLAMHYSFLSVTEAGLYHITAELARDAVGRGGTVGDAEYQRALTERAKVERESPHVKQRLYPELPASMPYVCFYPMNKRRDTGQNWYTLSLEERSRLMHAHGMTGRRYAGKVQQMITGAIGFDAWEWGVTLFAADPLEFKKLVTDMRFDEVSAKYAEFGDFYVGKVVTADAWVHEAIGA